MSRIRLLSALVEEYKLIRFFTLTLDPRFIKGDPWVYIHEPWSKLRKRLNRVRKGWKYAAVLERHKTRDVPHIHGFTDLWMHQREWSRHWNESHGGRIVWVEKVNDESASAYVSKQLDVASYVGKDQVRAPYKIGKQYRTFWRSKSTRARFELTNGSGWCILKDQVFDGAGELTDYWSKKGVWGGKDQRQRKDVETARGALPV